MGFFKKTALCVCLALVGCNSNDDDGSGRLLGQTPKPSIMPVTSSLISIDKSINSATVITIQKLTTPSGIVSFGKAVPTAKNESIVMALDANDNIRMAGFATGNQPAQLSAESTAVALVRLAIDAPSGASMQQLNQGIKLAADFPQLVQHIKTSLDNGLIPSDSKDVLKSVLVVVQQTVTNILNKPSIVVATTTKAINSQALSKTLPIDPSIKSPFPFLVIPNPNALGSVNIDSSRRIVNSIPIAWSMRSTDYHGDVIFTEDSDKNGNIFLEAASPMSRIASGVSDWGTLGKIADLALANAKVVSDGGDGQSFTLTVEQTPSTHKANIVDIGASIVKEIIPFAESEDCYKALAQAAISPSELAKFSVSPSFDSFVSYVSSVAFIDPLKELVLDPRKSDISVECLNAVQPNWYQTSATFIKAKVGFLIPLSKVVEKAVAYGSIAEKIWMISRHWDEEKNITVCMGRYGVIANCAEKFEIVPKDFLMIAGDIHHSPALKAFSADNKETLLPAKKSLEIASSLNLLGSDETAIYAMYAGLGKITIKDITTGKQSEQTIEVVNPVFDKNKIELNVGEETTLKLIDTQGRTITTSGQHELFDFSFSSVGLGRVEITPSSLNKLAIKIKALDYEESPISIIATNKQTLVRTSMVVIIKDRPTFSVNTIRTSDYKCQDYTSHDSEENMFGFEYISMFDTESGGMKWGWFNNSGHIGTLNTPVPFSIPIDSTTHEGSTTIEFKMTETTLFYRETYVGLDGCKRITTESGSYVMPK